jgi:hypothetical protein
MINKLIPIRSKTQSSVLPSSSPSSTDVKVSDTTESIKKLSRTEILNSLNYLSIGNPVKFSRQLNSLSAKKLLQVWNAIDLGKPSFQVNSLQLKSKTNIDPKDLKLDDVGYDYQKLLVTVVITATVLAFGSSFIGGQIGFILGYLSALLPVTLLGIGSITPALIGDILNRLTFLLDESAKDRYIQFHAGRFLVGYALGLPISKFSMGSPSNTVDFFQLKLVENTNNNDPKANGFFSKSKYSQIDIAPYSVLCLAGPVAECIEYSKASGYSATDVNVLNELMLAVEPAMIPESAQSHIKWAALQSYTILTKYKAELKKLREAFKRGASLEECIAELESSTN